MLASCIFCMLLLDIFFFCFHVIDTCSLLNLIRSRFRALESKRHGKKIEVDRFTRIPTSRYMLRLPNRTKAFSFIGDAEDATNQKLEECQRSLTV